MKTKEQMLRELRSLPSRREMDENIIGIMVDELIVTEGIIGNKFSTSLKIIDYFESLINKA